ncbi:Hachiman antiphage defense system protein HamA [Paenarthrobacter sp. NPDC090520]|uniref:Hachiman antiphage defense system protein HamA n=1 Tax=Paenarthrobacter sp. NPDC090520 TaxID=3364382 RepID=UPI0037F323FF
MSLFDSWCLSSPLNSVGTESPGRVSGTISSHNDAEGIELLASRLPSAYADTTALSLIAERYGKPGLANFLRDRLPTKKSARSGDAGEILATAYLEEEQGYVVGPSRLIDRDHQEWAMRGDDVLAAKIRDDSALHLVKAEAKSRVSLGEATVKEAREGLSRNDELPSPHSLSQFAARLLKTSDREIGEAVLDLQLTNGVRADRVGHLMFLLTSGDPSAHVSADLDAYSGKVPQVTVTLQVQQHQKFINDAYDGVVSDAP